MKKVLLLLGIIALCIGLCACNAELDRLERMEETEHVQYVGIWESGGHNYEKAIPVTIELMENGKALLHYVRTYDITQAPWAVSGDWCVDGNRVLIFYTEDGCTQANIFFVEDQTTLKIAGSLGLKYTKR